jgi:hypothetical protein
MRVIGLAVATLALAGCSEPMSAATTGEDARPAYRARFGPGTHAPSLLEGFHSFIAEALRGAPQATLP